jgi:glycosyltransferase A (GT-A) superfamily protein (DUF2064 family)
MSIYTILVIRPTINAIQFALFFYCRLADICTFNVTFPSNSYLLSIVKVLPQQIAILFFSRSSQAESRSKYRRFSNALLLSKVLISRSRAALENTGLPVYHIDEGHQRGNSFGDRLANATDDLFQLGYQKLIIVGNDAPGLERTDWTYVQKSLDQGKSVLGPNKRNGAYLIGLNREHFEKESFRNLPWQTRRLYTALADYLDVEIELSTLEDINTYVDFKRCYQKYAFLKSALLYFRHIESDVERIALKNVRPTAILRGPPIGLRTSQLAA